MVHGHDLRAAGQQTIEQIHPKLALVCDRQHLQLRAFFLAQQLPGDDVRVVLHLRDQHLIALADMRAAIRLRHEVDRFGRAAHEHDLARARGIQEALRFLAGQLVGLRGALAQQVDAAMDVRVVLGVAPHHRIDHRLRLLGRRGVVEVHQRFSMNLLTEDGEIAARLLYVEGDR